MDRLKLHPVKPKETNIFLLPEGFSLSGGRDSLHQVVYVSDINPRSVAATEGNLQLLDIIHYVNGVSTQGMTLEEAKRTLDLSLPSVVLKATRYTIVTHGFFCTHAFQAIRLS